MNSRKTLAILLVGLLTFSMSPADAATKSPTPAPSKKVTPKVMPTKKADSKKAPVKKVSKKKKKLAKLSPSPSPQWPPIGFKTDPLNESKIYLKVPTAKELVGLLSAKLALSSQIMACTEFTCGAVLVASDIGCRWWQIKADVIGATSVEDRTPKVFGRLTTSITRSATQQVVTVILVTAELIGAGHILTNIYAECNQSDPIGPIPNNIYEVINE